MPRLPIVGSDDGTWGTYLNEFLEVSLDNTNVDLGERGKLKSSAVDAAGAVMNADTSTSAMNFVVDEDNMASNSATKIPTQQSVKAYVDSGTSTVSGKSISLSSNTLTGTTAEFNTALTDNDFATLAGTEVLTNKTLSSAVLNTGVSGTAIVDEDDMASDSNTKIPTQQSVKYYSQEQSRTSRKIGSAAYKTKGLDDFYTAMETRGTTPVNIVVIGDSISIANCIDGESSFVYLMGNQLNHQSYVSTPKNGWRTTSGTDTGSSTAFPGAVPGFLTNQGTPVSSGSGGYSSTYTNGQKATYAATMDGVSVVYSTDPSYGSLEIRDGVGGTLLTTISTNTATKAGNIWTSNSLSLAAHTIEITSVGNNKVEAIYAHLADRASGVRMWNLSHSGWKTSDFLANTTTYLDFVENMDPDLVIISTGTNDTNSTTYSADLATLCASIQSVSDSDIAMWIPYVNANFTTSKLTAGRAFAEANNIPCFDSAALLGDTNFTGLRWQGFGVHPNTQLASVIARQGVSLLTGDPINEIEKSLATKAEIHGAYFTGSTSFSSDKVRIGSFFGFPYADFYGTGSNSQLSLASHSFGALFGRGAGLGMGDGSTANDTFLYRSAATTLKTNGSLIIEAPGTGSGNAVTTDGTQTLTNKTITSAVLNTGVSGSAITDEDNMVSNSNTKIPTQQSVKAYVDQIADKSNLTGSVAYRNSGLTNWFNALSTAHTTPRNIVIIGDSIASTTVFGVTKPWPWRLAELMAGHGRTPIPETTFRFATGTSILLMTSCQGSQKSPEIGMGGWAAELTTGQKATQTAVMDGISVVYSTSPGAGSLEVRDGVGGTLLTTINTNSAAKSSNIWTSGSLTLASHTIEITSVGTTILEGVYVHNGTRNKGIRVWSASHSGYTSQQMYSNPSFALDLIDNVNPDLVVIATGTNDGAANYATYMAGMISAVQLHTSADIAIWLPYTSPSGFPSTEDTAARAFLSTVGLPIIDAGYGVPNLAARFSPDNVHPNDNGHILLANHVFASIGGDPLGQFANQIGQNEITLATKAPIANPVFTGTITGSLEGSVTLNDIYGSASIGSIFGSPVIGLSNAIGDANPAIAFFPSTLAGMLGYPSATIIFGPGGVTSYDVGLTRTGSGEMTFFGSNSSTKSQLVVADPTTPGHATTKSYVDSRNHQLIAKESGQYYSMTGLTTASTSLTMTASGVLTSHPAFLQAGTYDRISVITTVAAVSTWRFGVYPSSPSTGLPDGEALILDCGTINMNSTPNLLTATISLTIPTTGVYWLGCLVDAYTATPTVHGWTTVSGTAQTPLLGAPVNNSGATAGRHAIGRTLTGVGTGSMPATYPASSWSQASPRISLRAS